VAPQRYRARNRPRKEPRRFDVKQLATASSWKHRFWFALHTRPLISGLRSPATERAWLASFARAIPCSGCRRHWREVIDNIPLNLASPRTHFAWTVRAHNAINRLLGKPIMSLRQARRLWTPLTLVSQHHEKIP
jgi:hypothetical protein